MTNKIKNYFENLKNDTKLRKQSIAIGSACLAVIVCAVAIPVGVHNHNVKKVAMAEAENSAVETVSETMAELTTADETTTVPEGYETTIVEADGTTKIELIEKTEPTSAVQPATNAPAANNGVTTTKKTSAGKNNGGSANSNAKDPTVTKAPQPAPAPETTTSAGTYGWSKVQADEFANWARQYGESIGLVWDDSFDLTNSCWQSSVWTGVGSNYDENVLRSKMKAHLDSTKNRKKATHFKIWVEKDQPTAGNWEFTILWM